MHLLQVGVGSGGIVVLDLVARELSLRRVTVIDPDVYAAHNVRRHLFPAAGVGRRKVDLAAEWLRDRRPDLEVTAVAADITDPAFQLEFGRMAAECDLGACAVDNEAAKYAFDAEMRRSGKPWTLGEVLSGGIGGWVHRFAPGGACYGCVASHLQRTVTEEPAAPPPDYANPGSRVAETTVPASRASIQAIAALHACATLDLLPSEEKSPTAADAFTSLLMTLRTVPGVFEDAYRTYRFRISRAPGCLVWSSSPTEPPGTGDILDVALDQALDRLAPQ